MKDEFNINLIENIETYDKIYKDLTKIYETMIEYSKHMDRMNDKLNNIEDTSIELSDESERFYRLTKTINKSYKKTDLKGCLNNCKYCFICIIIMIVLFNLISFIN